MTDKATPRQWRVRVDRVAKSASIDDADGFLIAGNVNIAAAELIVAAVNAYDPDREAKVRALVKAAQQIESAAEAGETRIETIAADEAILELRLTADALGETA